MHNVRSLKSVGTRDGNRMQVGSSIKTRSLVDQIIDSITNAIMDNSLKPGDRLPTENELAESFQVGKSSIREAIKVLQAVGIIEVRRGEGTFVANPVSGNTLNPVLYQMMLDSEPIGKLLELRMIFEPAYTVLAMKNATLEDLARIKEAKEKFEELVRNGKQRGKDDIEFHRCILYATHNAYVIRIGEMILQLLLHSIDKGCRGSAQKAIEDHDNIYNAMLAGNEEVVRLEVMNSFEFWLKNN